MPNVLFFTDMPPAITDLLTAYTPLGYTVRIHSDRLPDDEKATLLADADFLILTSKMPPEAAMRGAHKLKLIQLFSAGYNHINLPLCRELEIPVANNGGANSIDVAEHTLALILALSRKLFDMDRHVRTEHRYDPMHYGLSTFNIRGRTAGVVGMGQIGRRVAPLLNAFGAKVLYYDKITLSAEEEAKLGITRVELPDLLRQSDIVTLHVSLLADSYKLIGCEQLALMKPTALLINTCRGPVVDEAALIDALRSGQLRAAALDVLEQEPPNPNNPLFDMENVILSPHAAGNSHDTWARRGQFMFENIQRVWQGERPQAVVSA